MGLKSILLFVTKTVDVVSIRPIHAENLEKSVEGHIGGRAYKIVMKNWWKGIYTEWSLGPIDRTFKSIQCYRVRF